MKGRKPKPSRVKRLDGNPGKRAINSGEAVLCRAKPKCPSHLTEEAKREWRRVSKLLHQAGLLTAIDRSALAAYCQAWGRWVAAEWELQKHGPVVKSPSGYPIQNPYLSVANKAMEQMKRVMPELGMTPSSRSRINLEAPDAADDLERILEVMR